MEFLYGTKKKKFFSFSLKPLMSFIWIFFSFYSFFFVLIIWVFISFWNDFLLINGGFKHDHHKFDINYEKMGEKILNSQIFENEWDKMKILIVPKMEI